MRAVDEVSGQGLVHDVVDLVDFKVEEVVVRGEEKVEEVLEGEVGLNALSLSRSTPESISIKGVDYQMEHGSPCDISGHEVVELLLVLDSLMLVIR